MRLHKNLCFAVIDGLNSIFNDDEYADKVIQKLLKRDKRWGSRDRAFVVKQPDIAVEKTLWLEIFIANDPMIDNLWRLFAVWATLKGTNYRIGNTL